MPPPSEITYTSFSKLDLKCLHQNIAGNHRHVRRKLKELQNNYRRMQIMKMVVENQKFDIGIVAPFMGPKIKRIARRTDSEIEGAFRTTL